MSTTNISIEQLDIRDIQPGETYFAVTDAAKGGRCVLNGLFIAAWYSKAEAKSFAAGNPQLTVVKCLKPTLATTEAAK